MVPLFHLVTGQIGRNEYDAVIIIRISYNLIELCPCIITFLFYAQVIQDDKRCIFDLSDSEII